MEVSAFSECFLFFFHFVPYNSRVEKNAKIPVLCILALIDGGMRISGDSLSDEIQNRGPLALLSRRQYEFLFQINTVQLYFVSMNGYKYKMTDRYCTSV